VIHYCDNYEHKVRFIFIDKDQKKHLAQTCMPSMYNQTVSKSDNHTAMLYTLAISYTLKYHCENFVLSTLPGNARSSPHSDVTGVTFYIPNLLN